MIVIILKETLYQYYQGIPQIRNYDFAPNSSFYVAHTFTTYKHQGFLNRTLSSKFQPLVSSCGIFCRFWEKNSTFENDTNHLVIVESLIRYEFAESLVKTRLQ